MSRMTQLITLLSTVKRKFARNICRHEKNRKHYTAQFWPKYYVELLLPMIFDIFVSSLSQTPVEVEVWRQVSAIDNQGANDL